MQEIRFSYDIRFWQGRFTFIFVAGMELSPNNAWYATTWSFVSPVWKFTFNFLANPSIPAISELDNVSMFFDVDWLSLMEDKISQVTDVVVDMALYVDHE